MKKFGDSLKQGAKLVQQVEQTARLAKQVERGVKQGTRAVKKFIERQSKTKGSATSETGDANVPVATAVATPVDDPFVSESEKDTAVCSVKDDNHGKAETSFIVVEADTDPKAGAESQCSASPPMENRSTPVEFPPSENSSTAPPVQSTILTNSGNALELEQQYTEQLEAWRQQIQAHLQEHVSSSLPVDWRELDVFLQRADMDPILFSFIVLQEATPKALASFASKGSQQAAWVRELLLENHTLKHDMLLADGAASLPKGGPAQYGPALAIYHSIFDRSEHIQQSKRGILYRLAVAVALEHSVPIKQGNPAQPDKPMNEYVDPLQRYLHYETAYLQGELDPLFDTLTIWELRFVVNGEEPDEILSWGRSMLLNYRPDHLREQNYDWKYVRMVQSNIRYGSQDVQHDRPNLQQYQNILMNGGICGRRAFFGRFILRAFGIPTTARPSPGHGALIHWTPGEKYWVPNLGGPIGCGTTKTVYHKDTDFLATAKARSDPYAFIKVKRAMFYGDVLGEQRIYGENDLKESSGYWNRVSITVQKSVIQSLPPQPTDRRKIVERQEPTVVQSFLSTPTPSDTNKIQYTRNGSIVIPGSALENPKRTKDVQVMSSILGGNQIYLPSFQSQGVTIMRGGTFKSTAEACASGARLKSGGYGKYHDWSFRMALSGGDGGGSKLSVDLGNNVTMEFVHIPPGKFIMGGKNDKDGRFECIEVPKHEVEITRGFYLGKYPVTQAQWQQVMGNNPSKSTKAPDCPVDNIGESDALHFCGKMVDTIGKDFRLPTEAEWEYASRGGRTDDAIWFFGNDASLLGGYAWFKDNSGGKSHPVGQKKPNPFGIYDIYGNVFERVSDKYDKDYYKKSPRLDPTGPSQGTKSTMEYKLPQVPRAGTYALTARVVTANANQGINVMTNGGKEELVLSFPFSNGMWQESEPITLQLKEGGNVLRFWRDKPPQYGVAIKEWILTPTAAKASRRSKPPFSLQVLGLILLSLFTPTAAMPLRRSKQPFFLQILGLMLLPLFFGTLMPGLSPSTSPQSLDVVSPPTAWTVNLRHSSVARWTLVARILLACRRFLFAASARSDALTSPAMAAILTNPTWSLETFRSILALRHFAKDSSSWVGSSYADRHDPHVPPPLTLAILEPLVCFSDEWLSSNPTWQHLFWALIGTMIDYAIASLLEQISTSLLSSASAFSNHWESHLQSIMSSKITPKLGHIFPLNTKESKNQDNSLLTAANLPGLIGLLYWCSPATIISASEGLSLQNLRVVLLAGTIHQATCRRSCVSTAALLAVAVQMDSSLLSYGVPLLVMMPSTRSQVGFLGTFVAVSAYLVFLTRVLLGPDDYIPILQHTLLSSRWPGTAPSLSIWWYTHMQVFDRFQIYFQIMMAGLPWLVVLPTAVRLYRYPLTIVAIYWWVWTILQPVSTLHNLTVAICFLALSPRSLARINGNLSLIVMCALGVPVTLFVLLYGMWMQVGNGEANFLFFQCLAYNIFLLILLLQFVHSSVARDKALCLTEKQAREKEGNEGKGKIEDGSAT